MLRAPFSLEKTTYDAAGGMVIYRSKLHATLKRNFQVMPGVQWLELLCKHVPDRHEHMVRYYCRYSSRTRGTDPLACPECGVQMCAGRSRGRDRSWRKAPSTDPQDAASAPIPRHRREGISYPSPSTWPSIFLRLRRRRCIGTREDSCERLCARKEWQSRAKRQSAYCAGCGLSRPRA
jgi:hypothetical protein